MTCLLPGIADVQDKVHHLVHGDGSIVVGVGQPKDGGRHAPVAEDLVEGGGCDGIILADQIGDGLEKFDDVDAVLAAAEAAAAACAAAIAASEKFTTVILN